MSTCSNCYSGCVEIQSDKCIKYTGVDNTVLGILNGDSVNYVTSSIMGFLTSTLDGSGIKYELDPGDMCTLVSDQLTDCTDITVVEITSALSNAICSLDALVTVNIADITAINAAFTPDCVPGIVGTEGSHAVLQAVINHLCTVTTDLDALELNVATNYVLISDIDTYIANYIINNIGGGTGEKEKMVPYTVVEYYGPLNVFDASGAGLNDWAEIYLCNGDNGTPDKRGRIAVGSTSGMGGGTFPSATDPLISGNPTYSLYTTTGTNIVTLTESDIPAHTHVTTINNAGAHTHTFAYPVSVADGGGGDDQRLSVSDNISSIDIIATDSDGDHTHTTVVASTGGGCSHNNIPPVLACHYIIYIPTV